LDFINQLEITRFEAKSIEEKSKTGFPDSVFARSYDLARQVGE
jgi:hypothetical protein